MKITEKELAEKLRALVDEDVPNTWEECARDLAEYMGYQLVPERPEPGTWHLVLDGPYANQKAYVNGYSTLLIFADNGDYDGLLSDSEWPNLIPARFISEQELHDLNAKVDYQTRDIQDLSQILDLWKTKGVYAEARVSELRAELAGANETLCEMMPAEPVKLSEDEVKSLLTECGDDFPGAWSVRDMILITTTVNAAIAKHGHGRVEVTREQVLDAVEDAMTLAIRSGRRYQEPIVDAFMNLLGGGDRGVLTEEEVGEL